MPGKKNHEIHPTVSNTLNYLRNPYNENYAENWRIVTTSNFQHFPETTAARENRRIIIRNNGRKKANFFAMLCITCIRKSYFFCEFNLSHQCQMARYARQYFQYGFRYIRVQTSSSTFRPRERPEGLTNPFQDIATLKVYQICGRFDGGEGVVIWSNHSDSFRFKQAIITVSLTSLEITVIRR